MRFKSFYLDEASKRFTPIDLYPPELAKEISKNCKKYIRETKKHWFQRAMSLDIEPKTPGGYREVRQDRKPLGMFKPTYKKFNDWLVKNGHADRSKSVMCAREADPIFGDAYYVFIAGNYKYTWVRAEDINKDDDNTDWYHGIVDEYFEEEEIIGPEHISTIVTRDEYENLGIPITPEVEAKIERSVKKKAEQWVEKEFPKFFTTNKGMSTAWKENYEIWFQCKGYYFIRDNIALLDQMQRMIK